MDGPQPNNYNKYCCFGVYVQVFVFNETAGVSRLCESDYLSDLAQLRKLFIEINNNKFKN